MTKHHNIFTEAIKFNQSDRFDEIVAEARLFVETAKHHGYIDRYESDQEEKLKYRIYTFKIAGPLSEDRYTNASLLSSTWYSVSQTEKGIIEPRKKLFDYYLRVKQEKQKGTITLEFTVQGFSRHAKEIGNVPSLEIDKLDRRRTNCFFKKTKVLMFELRPTIEAKASQYVRKLERLTAPNSMP